MKSKNAIELDKTAITYDAVLGTGLIVSILESTERFEVLNIGKHPFGKIELYETHWEDYPTLPLKMTLPKLMNFIIKYEAEDYEKRGIWKTQKAIKDALGL